MHKTAYLSLIMGLLEVLFSSPTAAREPWEEMAERPLITWALEIGDARSLPWGDPNSWNEPVPGYNPDQLPDDTLRLLGRDMPVIVRMETIRRATIYSQKDPRVAYRLLAELTARVRMAEKAGEPNVLAWFDLGYLIETCKQADWLDKSYLVDLNGYALVVNKAMKIGGRTPDMSFAAGLMILEPKGVHPFVHWLTDAVHEAKEGSLLEKNLLIHFSDKGKTLDELRANRYLRRRGR